MTIHTSICALCFATFESQTSYGICPQCYNRDNLREFDRLETALHHARRARVPATLTLIEWLAILSDFNASCAYCLVEHFDRIEMVEREKGLVKGNVVPICKSCLAHRKEGWSAAVTRVQEYLLSGNGDETGKRYPYDREEDIEEVYV